MPLERRTRATFRRAEFGFLGVVVYTRVHTPRRCGLPLSAGVLVFVTLSCRPLRTNCWIVGTTSPSSNSCHAFGRPARFESRAVAGRQAFSGQCRVLADAFSMQGVCPASSCLLPPTRSGVSRPLQSYPKATAGQGVDQAPCGPLRGL